MKLHKLLSVIALALIAFCLLSGDVGLSSTGSMAAVAGYAVGDALLKKTKALPNGAAAVTSDGIDLGHGSNGANVADYEIYIDAPALNATQLPNSQTMTYDLVTSANSDMSSPTVVQAGALVQTGADSAGADAASIGLRLPLECERYVALKATKSGSGDASGSTATISLKF